MRSSEGDELHRILHGAGIAIEELPMIRFEWPVELRELDLALNRAARGEFEAILLSSPTAVNFFEERARELGLFEPLRHAARFGTVGAATAKELALLKIETAIPVPNHGGSQKLAAILAESNLAGSRVLLLQSNIGLDVLELALRELGATPERVTLYYTEGPSVADAARLVKLLESDARPDVIAFFSPSAVHQCIRALAEMSSGLLHRLPALAAIGETTARAIEDTLHRRPEIVARKADQESLATDILHFLQTKG